MGNISSRVHTQVQLHDSSATTARPHTLWPPWMGGGVRVDLASPAVRHATSRPPPRQGYANAISTQRIDAVKKISCDLKQGVVPSRTCDVLSRLL